MSGTPSPLVKRTTTDRMTEALRGPSKGTRRALCKTMTKLAAPSQTPPLHSTTEALRVSFKGIWQERVKTMTKLSA
jgi:hypothetical protein